MKKWFYVIGLGMLLLLPSAAFAVPAYPDLVKMKQPTGEEVSVYIKGDEKVHWLESPDGYSLLYDKNKRIVYAVADKTGDMVPSSIVFQEGSLRSSATDAQLTGIPKNLRYSASQISTLKGIWNLTAQSTEKLAPNAVNRSIRAICTLVQFPDKSFTKTIEDFEQLMNQSGYSSEGAMGSVRDFYYENSYGQLDLVVTVVGIYTAPDSVKYYGENVDNSTMNIDHMIELAGKAANYAFSQPGIYPSDYDNDNDGYIDAFHIIFAGYGEESGAAADAIWSHEAGGFPPFSFKSKKGYPYVYLDTYSCSPELRGNSGSGISRIGPVCHEIGHIFGLPDFYDVDGNDSGGNFTGTGKWDLMADGSWDGPNDNRGASPAHINMYSKIQLGWVNPVTLNSPQAITDMPNSAENPVAYIYNTPVSGEYFVLENRQKKGFDSYVPGTGLLIYHVSLTAGDISNNLVNNTHPQKMYPVCASSTVKVPNPTPASYGAINSSGCPFPGLLKKTSFTDYTTPSSVTWSGLKTNESITEIEEQDKMISFKFIQNNYSSMDNLTVIPDGKSGKAYPNPVKQGELLTIDVGDDFANTRLSFYSVSGQLLQQVDVSEPVYRQKIDFAPGIYTLQIRKNAQIVNRKIIVK